MYYTSIELSIFKPGESVLTSSVPVCSILPKHCIKAINVPYCFQTFFVTHYFIRCRNDRKCYLFNFSAGGIGVLVNLDRVANQMTQLAPEVEVRGIADSGWFLDYPQYRYKDCIEASNCAPVDGTKRGIK